MLRWNSRCGVTYRALDEQEFRLCLHFAGNCNSDNSPVALWASNDFVKRQRRWCRDFLDECEMEEGVYEKRVKVAVHRADNDWHAAPLKR